MTLIMNLFCTQPSPWLIPSGDKRFPFLPGWVLSVFEGVAPEGDAMTKTTQPPPNVGPESAPADAIALPWEGLKPCRLPDRQSIDLVGLPALVRWHMSAKNLHFPQAADAVHQKLMERRDSLTLYVAQSNGEARVVDDADCFGLDVRQGRRIISTGIYSQAVAVSRLKPLPVGVTPGQAAALYVVGAWGDSRNTESVMGDEEPNARLLAMPCEQAAALFGAGLVAVPASTQYEQLVAYRRGFDELPVQSRPAWSDENCATLRAEFDARSSRPNALNKTAILTAMAGEFDLSKNTIEKQIFREAGTQKRGRKPTPPATVSGEKRQIQHKHG